MYFELCVTCEKRTTITASISYRVKNVFKSVYFDNFPGQSASITLLFHIYIHACCQPAEKKDANFLGSLGFRTIMSQMLKLFLLINQRAVGEFVDSEIILPSSLANMTSKSASLSSVVIISSWFIIFQEYKSYFNSSCCFFMSSIFIESISIFAETIFVEKLTNNKMMAIIFLIGKINKTNFICEYSYFYCISR